MTIIPQHEVLFKAGIYAFRKDSKIDHLWLTLSQAVWPRGTQWYVYKGQVVVNGAIAAAHIQEAFQKQLGRLITE